MSIELRRIGLKGVLASLLITGIATGAASAQIAANETATNAQMEAQLGSSSITVSNLSQIAGAGQQSGTFTNGTNPIGIASGVFISTGRGNNVGLAATNQSDVANAGNTPDSDLTAIRSNATNDTAALEMTVTPERNTIVARMVFGSEEYPEYVCSNFNDAFGLFVSGPGVSGTMNFAQVPGSNTDISINTVNNGLNNDGQPCVGEMSNNSGLYNDNPTGSNFIFDGYTDAIQVVMTDVQPGADYTFKMVVADAIDTAWDSAVFVEVLSSEWEHTADLSLELTPSTATPVIGQPFTITATINNAGPDEVPFFKVADLLPAGLTFVSASGDGTYDDTNDEWSSTASIAANSDMTITLTVTATSVGTFSTAAEVIEQWSDDVDSTPADGAGDDYDTLSISTAVDRSDAPIVGTSYGEATHNGYLSLRLGNAIDGETASIANADASGDDSDDDGILSFPTFYKGVAFYEIPAANISATGTGRIHAWIDFDGDGEFEQSEYASTDVTSGAVDGPLSWSFQLGTTTAAHTFARFRFTSDPLTSADASGAASDGEVEDYRITTSDFSYTATCTAVGGGDSYFDETLYYSPQNTSPARGDHTQVLGAPDFDGDLNDNPEQWTTLGTTGGVLIAAFTDNLLANSGDASPDITIAEIGAPESASVHVYPYPETALILQEYGILAGLDGSYYIGEAVATAQIDIDAVFGNIFAEGRLQFGAIKLVSTTGSGDGPDMDAVTATNSKTCAEVRQPADYSDAPITLYGEASHVVGSGTLYLGVGAPDVEAFARLGGDNGADADGDDSNGINDEDGIDFSPLTHGLTGTIEVTVNGSGNLQAWIDFDNDGSFAGSGEQIASDVQDGGVGDTDGVANGTIVLSVTPPANGFTGISYARFRWSTDTGLTSTGAATDGEVEDYAVIIRDLDELSFTPDQRRTVTPGTVVLYPHTLYVPEDLSGGTLAFAQTSDQSLNWTIWHDVDASGDLTAADVQWVNGAALPATGELGFIVQAQIAGTFPAGWRDISEFTATVTLGTQTRSSSVTDVTDVSGLDAGTLTAAKFLAVDTDCDGALTDETAGNSAFEISKEGLPGTCVIYRITFLNDSDVAVTEVVVRDMVPAWTSYVAGSANYETVPSGMTAGTATEPTAGQRGALAFPFTGSLAAGDGGAVSYEVKIDE